MSEILGCGHVSLRCLWKGPEGVDDFRNFAQVGRSPITSISTNQLARSRPYERSTSILFNVSEGNQGLHLQVLRPRGQIQN